MLVKEDVLPQIRVLHYLLSQSSGQAVAHCLDLDLVATGKDFHQAGRRLDILVKTHIEYALTKGNYSALMTPAPAEYWKAFTEAMEFKPEISVLEIRVPQVVPTRQAESELPVISAAQHHLTYAVQ